MIPHPAVPPDQIADAIRCTVEELLTGCCAMSAAALYP
jgi:hypothetical protein